MGTSQFVPGCRSHTLPIPKNLITYMNNKTNFGTLRFEQLPVETCQLNILNQQTKHSLCSIATQISNSDHAILLHYGPNKHLLNQMDLPLILINRIYTIKSQHFKNNKI